MLTGSEIKRLVEANTIQIEPFDATQLNPNSYDLRLSPHIQMYRIRDAYSTALFNRLMEDKEPWHDAIDVQNPPSLIEEEMPTTGYTIHPGRVYLCSTVERTYSPKHIPQVSGKSSFGRLGIRVDLTGGPASVGFNGHWTLALTTVHPAIIYPGVRIAQVFFHPVEGEITEYEGRYQSQGPKPVPSLLHLKDWRPKPRNN